MHISRRTVSLNMIRTILIATVLFFAAAQANAQEQLTVDFTTTPYGGAFDPKNIVVVWVEDSGNNFVRTLGRWANNRATWLINWKASFGGTIDPDGVSGATRSDHAGTLSATWDMNDDGGSYMPDGTYYIRMELTDYHTSVPADCNLTSFTFVKDGNVWTNSTSGGGFNNVVLDYTGRVAAGGTLALSNATYLGDEVTGIVNVTVVRTGNTTGIVSVTIDTADGTATSPADFTALVAQTVQFADGESGSKNVPIVIKSDPNPEGAETFDVTISNATGGAVLGAQTTATVSITDVPVGSGGGGGSSPGCAQFTGPAARGAALAILAMGLLLFRVFRRRD